MEIENALNYQFNNKELINEAINLNLKLITIGESLINYYINLKLTKEFSYTNDGIQYYFSDDILNKLKSKIMNNDFYKAIITKLKLNDVIDDPTLNHEFLKAIIGALALDIDNQNEVFDYINKYFNLDEYILLNIDMEKNYPNLVFEWDKKKNKEIPSYKLTNFEVEGLNKCDDLGDVIALVSISTFDKPFIGKAYTNLMAIINAFKNAYKYLEDNDLLLKMSDIVGFPDTENCVNQLQELFLKGFINEPVYKISLKGSNSGVDIWKCRILIDGIRESFSAEDTSKKTAKRQAAFQMINYILNK